MILFVTDPRWAPLIIRVVLGGIIFAHGAQKVLGWWGGLGVRGTLEELSQMGFPPPIGMLTIIAQFFGTIAMVVGFLTRLDALGIAVTMLVAIIVENWKNGFFMNWFNQKKGEGFEYHLLALAMAVSLIVTGAGIFSVDRLISG